MKLEFFKIEIVLFLFLLFQNHSLIGKETPHEQGRYYISKENIAICDDGIAILGAASLIVAESLFHDEYGFYCLDSGVRWKCNWCGDLNPLDRSLCQACWQPYGSGPSKKK